MPLVKNKKGENIVEISNLGDVTVTTDGLESLQTTANTKLTSIDTRLDECIGHTNNTIEMGDGSNQLRSVMLGYDRANGKARSLLVDSGGKLECSVSDLEVTMQNVNLNTDTLETKIQSIDTRLDNTIGAINNTTAIGDGSSVLKTIPLGYDRANNKGVSFLVDSAGHQQIDIVSTALPTGSATSANQVIIEASLTAMEAKMDVDNVVYDNQLTKLTEIDTAIDTIDAVLDASLVKQTNIETLITTLDGVQDNALTKLGEIETTNNAIQSAVEGTLTVASHAVTNAGTFAVQAACSGTVTANLSAVDNAVLDDVAQKLGDIETAVQGTLTVGSHAVTNAGTFAVQAACSGTVTANLSATDNAVLDAIETTNNAIQSAVEGTLTVGSHAVTNAGTFAVQAACSGTVTANLGATDNAVLDDIAQKLGDIETAVQILDNAISGNEMQVDIVSIPTTTVSGTVTANLSATDNAVLDAIATDLAALEVLQTSTNSKIDTFDAVLDASLVKQTNIETLITTLDGVQDNVLTKITNNETLLTAIDSDTNNIKDSTASMVTDLAALEVLNTSILAKLAPVKTVTLSQDNVTIANSANNTSSAIDIRTVKHLGFSGSASSSGGGSMKILASSTSSGTYLEVGSGTFNSGALQAAAIPNAPYHYIKIQVINETGGSLDYTVSVFQSS